MARVGWRRALWIAWISLALLLPAVAEARKPAHLPAWEREVGRRQGLQLSRRQQRRLDYGPQSADESKRVVRDIPISAAKTIRSLEALKASFAGQAGKTAPRVTLLTQPDARYPVYKIDIPAQGRPRDGKRPVRVLVSSWIHGDEPVGPTTALQLVDYSLRKKNMRRDFDLSVVIKVDRFGTRNTPDGVNLNRAFADGKWTPETAAIRDAVSKNNYDLFMDLHADTEPGFFAIWEADRAGITGRALSAMRTGALLDATPKNHWVGDYNFHMLGGATTEGLAGCFDRFMARKGTPYSYTLEAPRTLSPAQQVRGMLKLVRSTMYNVARHGKLDR